ncbi:threonine ammonia-lyase [Bauldia sp.]|uniref:threonine ammonia-lyase n=1 Tax=Bauldia sp. TaxID=2575872 RepID=UPI003BA9868F
MTDIRAAEGRLNGLAARTPLIESAVLNARVGGRVLLKCENLQRTGSFKFRGAYNALASLSEEERKRGVVAVSSGNHAQGVAEAARLLGIQATIVMPSDAPTAKRGNTERSGARVVEYDRATEHRETIADEIVDRTGAVLIHPFDNLQVIAGQGTVGLEIVDQVETLDVSPDMIVTPCGGGGLSAGVGLAVRSAFPECTVVLVEPEAFDDYGRSLTAGRRLDNLRSTGSVCDALMAQAPGEISFEINREHGAQAVAVSDRDAFEAVALAARELKLIVEPGGAVALAALLAGRVDCREKIVVVILSGGNVDDQVLSRALSAW